MVRRRLSDYRVKKIIRCFSVDLTATQTSQMLLMSRGTINVYYRLFRELIWEERERRRAERVLGAVEFDESYFGATRPRGVAGKLKRGRGTLKQPVFGIFERGGEVLTEVVPDCSKKTLQGLILGHVALESVVYSDGWRGYDGLVDVGYDRHLRLNHKETFSKGNGLHINGIESFWSFTKRRLAQFNGVKVNFDLHLKECEWRWKKTEAQMDEALFKLFKTLSKRLVCEERDLAVSPTFQTVQTRPTTNVII